MDRLTAEIYVRVVTARIVASGRAGAHPDQLRDIFEASKEAAAFLGSQRGTFGDVDDDDHRARMDGR